MPEGPEVTILAKSLNKLLKNRELKKIKIIKGGKYEEKSPLNFRPFTKKLPLKVEEVKNKGKLIYWIFSKKDGSSDFFMINHLNMTGIWSINQQLKHSALEFVFKNPTGFLSLFYTDIRRFGKIEFGMDIQELKPILNILGPDIVNDKGFSFKDFEDIAALKRRINITKFLMDQHNISGIGNYLKSEILYAAKVSPHRNVGSLSKEELKNIYDAAKKISKMSMEWKGMSKSDFRDIDGTKGDFQKMLKVYCLDKDLLGNKIAKEKTKDGRTTHWVPELQV
jgi:formamidopyrimidine-DNA glycosylase